MKVVFLGNDVFVTALAAYQYASHGGTAWLALCTFMAAITGAQAALTADRWRR